MAYLLVFGGYILVTTNFGFGRSTIGAAQQVEDLCWRVGGLVLTMGVLHAATIIVLPVVALVSNSTRVGRALPRWLVVVLVLAACPLGLFIVWSILGTLVAGVQ